MRNNLICVALLFVVFLASSCTKQSNDDLLEIATNSSSLEESGTPHLCTEMHTNNARAFGSRSSFWNKSVLRVRFLDGNSYVQSKVRQYANEWSQFAKIEFQFVENEPSDIRISFDPDSGSWSYVGRNNAYIPSHRATMNFGWFNNRTSESEFRRTTLHEFGHALGLSHEHQHPEVNIDWNREAVYSYYSRTQDWSQNDVDRNIFQRYSAANSNFSDYDQSSIMHYYIPRSLVNGVWNPTSNSRLSSTDVDFIQQMYPGIVEEELSCHCPDTLSIVACEDFESLAQTSFELTEDWSKWSEAAGHAELQTYSWGKVLKMQYDDALNPDVVYHPKTIEDGSVTLSWDMYVGQESTAYFNIQKEEEFGKEFGAQVYFDKDLKGRLQINGGEISFEYRQNEWNTIDLEIDADRDQMRFILNGEETASWPLSWTARSEYGTRKFAGINFYNVDQDSRFWLDGFCLSENDVLSGEAMAFSRLNLLPDQSIKGR